MLFPRRSAQPVENSQLCLFYFFFGTNDDSPFYSLYFLRFAENSSKKNYPKNNSTYCFRRIVFDQLFSTNCYSTNRFSINCFSPNFLSTNYLSNNSFSPNFFFRRIIYRRNLFRRIVFRIIVFAKNFPQTTFHNCRSVLSKQKKDGTQLETSR